MPAHAEEHRHHAQFAHAIGVKRSRAIGQRRLHQFQESEHHALAGQPFAEFYLEFAERARPVRVARAVGKEDGCACRHASIIAESR